MYQISHDSDGLNVRDYTGTCYSHTLVGAGRFDTKEEAYQWIDVNTDSCRCGNTIYPRGYSEFCGSCRELGWFFKYTYVCPDIGYVEVYTLGDFEAHWAIDGNRVRRLRMILTGVGLHTELLSQEDVKSFKENHSQEIAENYGMYTFFWDFEDELPLTSEENKYF